MSEMEQPGDVKQDGADRARLGADGRPGRPRALVSPSPARAVSDDPRTCLRDFGSRGARKEERCAAEPQKADSLQHPEKLTQLTVESMFFLQLGLLERWVNPAHGRNYSVGPSQEPAIP